MKKQYYLLIVATLLASVVLAGCGIGSKAQPDNMLEAVQQRGYILISTDLNYEPQSWLNPKGTRPADTHCPPNALTTAEMQGFDVDVAKAIGDYLGVETCFATPGWETVVAGRWEDKWDMSVGSMTITTERQKLFDFSVPYYYSPAVVALRADAGFSSLDELASQALCVGVATTYETWLQQEELGPTITVLANAPDDITIIPLDTDQLCPNSIIAGRNDFIGYVTSEIVVDSNIAEGMPVVKIDGPVFYERLAAAFDKAASLPTDTLRAQVDTLFTKMHADGSLTELSKKWFKDENGEGLDYTVEPQ